MVVYSYISPGCLTMLKKIPNNDVYRAFKVCTKAEKKNEITE